MIDQVYKYMTEHNMVPPGGRILAAVSGGADSMCLLEVLRELQKRMKFEIRVLHVHHGLRESADRDLDYVSEFCGKAEIPFKAVRVDAAAYASQNGLSMEEGARSLRYRALEQAADEGDREADKWDREVDEWDKETQSGEQKDFCRIAVAHHVEDQAETVLFNLIRGSRLTGVRGMLPVNGRIIRPLLGCRRTEIESFLTSRGINWCEDETNEDTTYSRNLLRREVIPLLEKINSKVCEHIAGTAEEVAETEEFLRGETQSALKRCLKQAAGHETVENRTAEAADYETAENRTAEAAGHETAENRTAEAAGHETVENRTAEAADLSNMPKTTLHHALDIPSLLREAPLLQRRVVYTAIAEVMGTRKDLQNVHVQDVLKVVRKPGNGEICLPGGVIAKKVYAELHIVAPAGSPQAMRRKASPAKAMSRQANPEKGMRRQANPEKSMRRKASPEKATLRQASPEKGMSRQASPAKAMHQDEAPAPEFTRSFRQWWPESEGEYSWRVLDFDGDMGSVPRNRCTKWFDYDKIGSFPIFRTRLEGDRMTIDAEGRSKSIARFMIDAKVPAEMRGRIVLPTAGKEVLWFPGGRISAAYPVEPSTSRVLEIKWNSAHNR